MMVKKHNFTHFLRYNAFLCVLNENGVCLIRQVKLLQ